MLFSVFGGTSRSCPLPHIVDALEADAGAGKHQLLHHVGKPARSSNMQRRPALFFHWYSETSRVTREGSECESEVFAGFLNTFFDASLNFVFSLSIAPIWRFCSSPCLSRSLFLCSLFSILSLFFLSFPLSHFSPCTSSLSLHSYPPLHLSTSQLS